MHVCKYVCMTACASNLAPVLPPPLGPVEHGARLRERGADEDEAGRGAPAAHRGDAGGGRQSRGQGQVLAGRERDGFLLSHTNTPTLPPLDSGFSCIKPLYGRLLYIFLRLYILSALSNVGRNKSIAER